MSGKIFLPLVSVACLLIARVACINLIITPDHVRVSKDAQSVSYTCTADVALAGCQFRWWDWDTKKAGPLLDLSRGSQSQANSSHLDTKITGYSYSGRGLGAGDCEVSLRVKGYKQWIVACRVRAETGSWTYAWADLDADTRAAFPHTVTPRESVVLPGGEARFSLKGQESLGMCRFFSPGLVLFFDEGAQSNHSTGRHLYLGGGLGGGECGLALANVSEADNGPVRGYIRSTAGNADHRFMALIVTSPPGSPILNIIYTDAGVTATCVVPGGRPVAGISWVLGDQVVRHDFQDDSPAKNQDGWRWPWAKVSIQQNLTVERQTYNNAKLLKCVVSHVTLPRPLEVTEMILFPASTTETTPLATSPRTTAQPTSTSPGPHTTPDPACTATSMLGLLCQEYRGRASQLDNTLCPRDEVYELRVREAGAAARSAELAEEQAKVNLEAAKIILEAANSSAKAEETSKALLAQVALEAAKVNLEAAKAEETSRALLAQVALEAAKSSAKAEETSRAILAQVALEAAKAEETSRALLAQVALEAAKSSAKSEAARAREEEAWAKNAEEELEFERQRRGPSLPQPQTAQSEQG